ncbi:MAG: putative aminohydrolase SsnA [Nitrospinota bacterium]
MLITNGPLLTFDPEHPFFDRGAVRIEDGRVTEAGDAASVGQDPGSGEEVLDAAGRLILPGWIDVHTHLYSAFARGIALKEDPPENFVQILERLWWRLDRVLDLEDVRLSALVGLVACIRNGTTTVIDHHASPSAIEGSLDVLADAFGQSGLRGVLCYEVTDRNGEAGMKAGIGENVRFLKKVKDEGDKGGRLGALFGLHAPLTLSDDTLARCLDAGRAVGDEVGFHVHVSEHEFEVTDSLNRYGKRPLQRLRDAGVLGGNSIAAHCIHVDEGDLAALRETEAIAVHNPQSNMNNAVGCAPIRKWTGVLAGLGTDGMTADMMASARAAYLLQKHEAKDPRVAWDEVRALLTAGNPAIASRLLKRPVGVLRPGALGDVVISDYLPPTPLRGENFWGHLLYGAAGLQARTVVVGGGVVMRDRALSSLDEEEIFAKARERAAKVWERF